MLKTKFRVEECLVNNKLKNCAITEDGEKHLIQQMEDGTEYFVISNPYKSDDLGKHFIGCIADAIKSIQEDYADVLLGGSHINVFSNYDFPIVLLDREKGEELRKKSKLGWKNSKFGWAIEYGGKNSFGGYHMVDECGNIAGLISENYPKVYVTEKEAEEQFEKWYKSAIDFANEYVTLYDDEEKRTDLVEGIYDKSNSIVRDIFIDMIKDEGDTAVLVDDLRNLPNIGWRIVQAVA